VKSFIVEAASRIKKDVEDKLLKGQTVFGTRAKQPVYDDNDDVMDNVDNDDDANKKPTRGRGRGVAASQASNTDSSKRGRGRGAASKPSTQSKSQTSILNFSSQTTKSPIPEKKTTNRNDIRKKKSVNDSDDELSEADSEMSKKKLKTTKAPKVTDTQSNRQSNRRAAATKVFSTYSNRKM
jgi:hypothetical protein